MATEPITYVGIHLGPNAGSDDAIVGVRVVPNGNNGNEVYGRTLSADELDTGEGITLEVGEKLVFPPGSVKVTIQDVDRYPELEPDGYASLTNTAWTWLQVPPLPGEAFFNFVLAASRRIDMAHAHCVSALRELGDRPDEPFIRTRARIFNALGNAESMCIALNRAVRMIKNAHVEFTVTTPVPSEVEKMQEAVSAIRNAFEHIDDRAMGRAHRENPANAMSIFNQADLVSYGILRYASHSLNLRTEVIPALVAARRFIFDVIAEAGTTKTINTLIEFGPVTDDWGVANLARR